MSRVESWEDDEPYPNATALFERAVENAMKGRRGQALLKEIEAALLALPEKKLVAGAVCRDGQVCMLGSVVVERAVRSGKTRAEALAELERKALEWGQDDEDGDETFVFLKDLLGIKQESLAWTLVYQNDEIWCKSPEDRYERMLEWIRARIAKPGPHEMGQR